MNPIKLSRGSSFKGLTAYLQGDRDGQHRAEWSETLNLGTDNIHMAARVMAASAMDADHTRRENGWNGRGRKATDKPVLHLALSWDQQTHPDHTHQAETARAMLKAMGLEQAQAVLVGHNDNGQDHVHIAVNIINPDTGEIWRDPANPTRDFISNDTRKMQAFALDYCRAHGIESSPNREKNAQARANHRAAQERGDPAPAIAPEGTKRLSRPEWLAMKNELFTRHGAEHDAMKSKHGQDWEKAKAAIAEQKRQAEAAWKRELTHQKAEAKERNRPVWRETFNRQKAEIDASQITVRDAERRVRVACSMMGRAAHFTLGLGQSVDQAKGSLAVIFAHHNTLPLRHELERRDIRIKIEADVSERTKAAMPGIPRPDIDAMKDGHQKERQALREKQAQERAEAGIRPRTPDPAKEQDNAHAQREREKQRKDDRPKWGKGQLSARARQQAKSMKERDRADRQRGDDGGREM